MTNMTPEHRATLRRKYAMDEPTQQDNPIVNRILAVGQLHGRVFTRDSSELFDPVRNPRMHEKLVTALRDLHAGIATGRIRRNCHDPDSYGTDPLGEPFNPDDPELLVHILGTDAATVVRGAKRLGAFERATRDRRPQRRGVDYFAGMYQVMTSLHDDFWEIPCNVNLARNCGGAPQLMPYIAGTVLLIFAICMPCLEYAVEAARTGYELSVMEARMRAGLPPDDG
jgi:hypothetical protein